MEKRWLLRLGPPLVAVGALGLVAAVSAGAASDRPWDPPDCGADAGSAPARAALSRPGGPEARPAGVEHERRVGQHVAPAGGERPQAEVVLLAVALAEAGLVEQPDLGENPALDVEAEADTGR